LEFQRARNIEQKQVRQKQILSAASNLMDQLPYKDITLNMIASKLEFSRANISHYYQSKEEIFLALFIQDGHSLSEDLMTEERLKEHLTFEQFALIFSEIVKSHINFLRIGSILTTVIELNIDTDKLVTYKKLMYEQMEEVAKVLMNKYSFFDTKDKAMQLVRILYNYMAGLFPRTNPTSGQKEAITKVGNEKYYQLDFCELLKEMILITLKGFEVLSNDLHKSKK
jgi:AcrR family transcriptional regulator